MKFLLPFLVVLLNSGINSILAGATNFYSDAEIKQTKSIEFENTWLSGHAALFSSPTSGEQNVNYRERLTESSAEEEPASLCYPPCKNTCRVTPDSIYLECSKLIDGSQTARKLLFPFHSFL